MLMHFQLEIMLERYTGRQCDTLYVKIVIEMCNWKI
jgi:hypothetical protein